MTTAKPLTPQQALASLQVEAGLRVELAAAEPLVVSPCAVAWDERGRMFVAENRGYPVGPGTNKPPVGVIAMLESTKGDGVYDKRTEFATGLTFPNGLMCWRGGLIVTCAPDIFYLKDTDGDGKADVKRVLLTSFGTTSTTQLRVSHPTLGLDGWIHVTSGLVASKVTCPEHPERGAIDLPRGDARFHPDTLEIEPWPGVGQFGLAFDDFGRKFVCSNRNPLQHVVLHPRYLKRNPHLAFSETVQDVSPFGDAGKCWPLSEDHTTAAFIPSLMSAPHAGTFTSACGISLWRGGALPAAFANSAFICEPAQNLVQRQVLTPDGPTFKSAPATPGREFLASADTWFRPVFSATGPDGALYICDMYRKVIDHPQYLPEFIRSSLDYEAGKNMGRIWRVVPEGPKSKVQSPKFDLGKATTKELVAKLNDANGWVRTTAFRLLTELAEAALTTELRPQAAGIRDQNPAGIVAAMHLTANLGVTIGEMHTLSELASVSPSADVRSSALELNANRFKEPRAFEFASPFLNLREDKDAKVRFNFALGLGDSRDAKASYYLAVLGAQDGSNKWMRAAVLSSAGTNSAEFCRWLFRWVNKYSKPIDIPPEFAGELGRILAASQNPTVLLELAELLTRPQTVPMHQQFPWQAAAVTGMANGLRGKSFGDARIGFNGLLAGPGEAADRTRRHLEWLMAEAVRAIARDGEEKLYILAAIDLLAHSDFATAGAALQLLIAPQTPNELQAAAVRALSQLPGAKAGEWFVERERWRSYTPPVRDAVLTAMLSQPALQLVLLEAVEKGVVQPWAVPANRRNPLLKHKDAAVAARAAKAFQPQGAADRMKVYEDYKSVLALPANAKNGKAVFTKTCAACHQFAGEGQRVGPELTGIRLQPAEAILLHIIVPDAEIYPGFTAYDVETKDGRTLTGLLASDTPTSVTLRAAQGVEDTILRSNIAKLTSSSTSLMPNELEKTMTRQDMADLLAFLKGQ